MKIKLALIASLLCSTAYADPVNQRITQNPIGKIYVSPKSDNQKIDPHINLDPGITENPGDVYIPNDPGITENPGDVYIPSSNLHFTLTPSVTPSVTINNDSTDGVYINSKIAGENIRITFGGNAGFLVFDNNKIVYSQNTIDWSVMCSLYVLSHDRNSDSPPEDKYSGAYQMTSDILSAIMRAHPTCSSTNDAN